MVKTSSKYRLDWRDAGKGLIVAIGTAVVASIQAALTTTPVVFNWKNIGLAALAAGVAYLGKNFFTPAAIVKKPLGAE